VADSAKKENALVADVPKKKLRRVAAVAFVAAAMVGAAGTWMAWSPVQQASPTVAQAKVSATPPLAVPTQQPPTLKSSQPTQDTTASAVIAPLAIAAPPSVSVPASVPSLAQPASVALAAPAMTALAKPAAPKAVRATGTLNMAISPWGRVSVDGRSMGVAPPLTRLTLPVGKHTVTVQNDESPAHTQTIQVEAGQTVQITHSF